MLKVYNTLSRNKEPFEPLSPPRVNMYTCGPTVYDYAHIGNFRAYVFEDLLRRVLLCRGFEVVQVMNLTDIDDKTIKGSRAAGIALNDYTRKFKDAFFQDLSILNINKAEHYPAATDHIEAMIELVRKLLEKGYAYQSEDGSVYFSIKKFPAYGKLARLDMAGLQPGARVAQDEYHKENAADFALWKAWNEGDGDVWWDSPWGKGRPGWHMECSAMSMSYLGPTLDLHTGGVDNIFPHHEDEIAQSEAATGKPFVKYWMHCGHLLVDERKMSKSEGNCYKLEDLLKRGFSGRDIRYLLISAHYRQSLNFTFESLEGARNALLRLDEFYSRLRDLAENPVISAQSRDLSSTEWPARAKFEFDEALNDDLNVAEALSALFGMVHEGNRRMDAQTLTAAEAKTLLDVLGYFDKTLGVLNASEEPPPPDALALASGRQAARAAKNWNEADRLRDELTRQGWSVQDTNEGFKLRRISR